MQITPGIEKNAREIYTWIQKDVPFEAEGLLLSV